MKWLWRASLALLCWIGAGAMGWWWQRASVDQGVKHPDQSVVDVGEPARVASSPAQIASAVAAADLMGLSRNKPGAPTGSVVSGPASEAIVWRLAALVVRDAERFAVMTSTGQPPLRLRVGDYLPDGDRISAIYAGRIEIQSPRRHTRTLYLIEP